MPSGACLAPMDGAGLPAGMECRQASFAREPATRQSEGRFTKATGKCGIIPAGSRCGSSLGAARNATVPRSQVFQVFF